MSGITAEALTGLVCDTYMRLQTAEAHVNQLAQHVKARDERHDADQARIAELEAELALHESMPDRGAA